MQLDPAKTLALEALSFILSQDTLRDRFLTLSGVSSDDMRRHIEDTDFLVSPLDFLISHEPDLLVFSEHVAESPERIVKAWRALGGGIGQEW